MGARVLIAEDNSDCRASLWLLLTSLGCTVVEAKDGLEAIRSAVSTRPDLILMDVFMPQFGGLEATKRLKEDPRTRDIPVVLCTAVGMEALGHRRIATHPHEVIQKPVRLKKLREVLQKYVPQENPQQRALAVKSNQNSTDVRDAWLVLGKIRHAIKQESLRGRVAEPHNFDLARSRKSH